MTAPSPSDAPGPEAPPLWHDSLNTPLPSCDIPKQTLLSVDNVLNENIDLKGEEKAGTLWQKLAKEAVFGRRYAKVHPSWIKGVTSTS